MTLFLFYITYTFFKQFYYYLYTVNKNFPRNSEKELELKKISQSGHLLSKSESVKFSRIESVIFLFTDSSVRSIFLLLNQLIFTEIISEI